MIFYIICHPILFKSADLIYMFLKLDHKTYILLESNCFRDSRSSKSKTLLCIMNPFNCSQVENKQNY